MARRAVCVVVAALACAVQARHGRFGPVPPAPPVRGGLLVQLDAAYGTLDSRGRPVAAADPVTTWKDFAAGGGENDAQGSDTKSPFLIRQRADLKNAPALDFKNGQQLDVTVGLTRHMPVTNFTMAVVSRRPIPYDSDDYVLNFGSNVRDRYVSVHKRYLSSRDNVYLSYALSQSSWVLYGFQPPDDSFVVASGVHTPQRTYSNVDIVNTGNNLGSRVASSTYFLANSINVLNIGNRGVTSGHLTGQIAEVLVFSRALQDTEVQALSRYLLYKYSPALSCHPSCRTCGGSSDEDCLSCPVSTPYLMSGECLEKCPNSKSNFFGLRRQWGFESGNLTIDGFTVDSTLGTAFQGQPILGSKLSTGVHQGRYLVRTDWVKEGGSGGDKNTGVAYSESWKVGNEGTLKFLVAGGNKPCQQDFDPAKVTKSDDCVAVTLERQSGNSWAVVRQQTGTDRTTGWSQLVEYAWELDDLVDETVRIGIYDLSDSAYGYIAVDDLRYYERGTFDLYTDESLHECVSALECPESLTPFADPKTRKCAKDCNAANPFGSLATRVCASECPTPFYEADENSCVVNCTEVGLYANDEKRKCEATCSNGFGLEEDAGSGDQVVTVRRCVNDCPKGMVGDSKSRRCVSSCSDGLFAYDGECKDSCPTGYFGDSIGRSCGLACPPSFFGDSLTGLCASNCSSDQVGDPSTSKCQAKCSTSYYAYRGLCAKNCPTELYGDAESGLCVSLEKCNGWGNDASGLCVDSCQKDGLLADPTSKKCVVACPTGLYESDGECVNSCPANYFRDPISDRCESRCTGGLVGDLTSGNCVTECPTAGLFKDPITMSCVVPTSCSGGTFASNVTQSCVGSCAPQMANAETRRCVDLCPPSQYGDPTTNTCVTSCNATGPFPLGSESDRMCVDACPADQFASYENGRCVTSCGDIGYYGDTVKRRCVGPLPDNPSKIDCSAGYYADALTMMCVSDCPDGYHGDATERRCVTDCAPKFVNDGVCEENCTRGFGDSSTMVCVSICPEPTFGDRTNALCVVATDCSNGQVALPWQRQCVSQCPQGLLLDVASNVCVLQCPAGTFANTDTARCGPSSDCPAGSFGDAARGACVPECPTDFYGDDSDGQRLCVPAESCPTGKVASPLPTRICTDSCPSGYFVRGSAGGADRVLPANMCVTGDKCIAEDLFGDPTKTPPSCVDGCTLPLVGNTATGVCEATCPAGYATLTEDLGWICTQQCAKGYFGNGPAGAPGAKCEQCDSSCITCAGNATACTACKEGDVLNRSGQCGPQCDPTDYSEDVDGEAGGLVVCKACNETCQSCTNQLGCVSCVEDKPYIWRGVGDDGMCHKRYNATLPCPPNRALLDDGVTCVTKLPNPNPPEQSTDDSASKTAAIVVGVVAVVVVVVLIAVIVHQRRKTSQSYPVAAAASAKAASYDDPSTNPVFESGDDEMAEDF